MNLLEGSHFYSHVPVSERVTCMNCLQSDDKEDIHMIVKLNVAKNVNTAFDNFLNEEVILYRECPNTMPLWKREWW